MSVPQTTIIQTVVSAAEAYRAGQEDMLARAIRCVERRGWQMPAGSDIPKALAALRIMDLSERQGGGK